VALSLTAGATRFVGPAQRSARIGCLGYRSGLLDQRKGVVATAFLAG
jgi:hypothetical protein